MRNSATGEDLEWTVNTFNSTFAEYNLIRSTNPQISVTVGEMPVEQPIAPSQQAFNTLPGPQDQIPQSQPLYPMENPGVPIEPDMSANPPNPPSDTQPASQNPPSWSKSNDFLKYVSSELQSIDAKYKVKESLKESYDRGVQNVKAFFAEKSLKERVNDGIRDTKEWIQANVTRERITEGFKSASYVVIRGAVFISTGITKGLSYVLERMEAARKEEAEKNRENALATTLLDPAPCMESPMEENGNGNGNGTQHVNEMKGNLTGSGMTAYEGNRNPPVNQIPLNQPLNPPLNQIPLNQPLNHLPLNQIPLNPPAIPSLNQPLNPPVNQVPLNQRPVSQVPVGPLMDGANGGIKETEGEAQRAERDTTNVEH